MTAPELSQHPWQVRVRHRGDKSDADLPELSALDTLCSTYALCNLRNCRAGIAKELRAGRSELNATTSPQEQLNASFLFQRANLLTQGRLRHVQSTSGSPEMQLFGDRDEISEVTQLHFDMYNESEWH